MEQEREKANYGRHALLFTLMFVLAHTELLAAESGVEGQHFWLWTLLGRLHPMVVHFPISLIVVVLLLEIIQGLRRSTNMRAAIQVLLAISVLSSIAAVAFGLLLANTESYGSDILPTHQWSGIATMLLAICCWWL